MTPGAVVHLEPAAARAFARVVFTGKLSSMTRREAGEIVRDLGGQVLTAVSRRTTMLVVGLDGWPVLPDGTVSRSLRRAEELNRGGAHIRIVSQSVFLESAGLETQRPDAEKSYALPRVAELIGVGPEIVERWEAQGLIRSTGGRYDFQDIVSLRAIAGLIARGVRPAVIARTVKGLSAVLPDAARPLAQLQLVEQSGALLAEIGDVLLAPDGQFMMNYDAPEPDGAVETILLTPHDVTPPRTADDWLEAGHAHETEERHAAAADAYRHALSERSHFPEAHFNLGNALRAGGDLVAAREHLLMAVIQDPEMPEAWYNLADVQEELDDVDDAIESLRQALRVEPAYADAHYNLALCYEQADRADDAKRHWRSYLQLDPDSPWAQTAREHLCSSAP